MEGYIFELSKERYELYYSGVRCDILSYLIFGSLRRNCCSNDRVIGVDNVLSVDYISSRIFIFLCFSLLVLLVLNRLTSRSSIELTEKLTTTFNNL